MPGNEYILIVTARIDTDTGRPAVRFHHFQCADWRRMSIHKEELETPRPPGLDEKTIPLTALRPAGDIRTAHRTSHWLASLIL